MSKHLIVVSIDAMVFEDLEYCKDLPNFSKIMDGASVIERVRTIYPSVTHPVHATLITGAPAGVTRIVNNSVFNSESPAGGGDVWYNFLDQIGCETIFHAAKRAGLTTASASWPVTNRGESVIDYLVPCALNADFRGFESNPIDAYRSLGAGENVIDIIEEAVKRFGWQNRHPEVEEFQAYCCTEIIKRYKPNLLLTHPSYVDDRRHAGGVFGEKVNHALKETDRWLGMLLDAVRDAGIENETDIVLLSDHGQINITRTISPNVYLADAGYITLDDSGTVTDWQAYSKSTGASAHVYLKEPKSKELYDRVYSLLSDMAREGIYGFEKVYTAEEMKEKYGLFGDFSFVLETDGYTSFGEWTSRPSVRGYDLSDYRFGKGTHGHEPHKGPQPMLIAKGPSFKRGVTLPEGCILNHAPTLARALGIDLPDATGHPVSEILE
ncbi:MAG: alkaline phosphatase family protein [Clostridia bacterium]|nr:alkaline phosphatase family protein [Clostridia bacterium]